LKSKARECGSFVLFKRHKDAA